MKLHNPLNPTTGLEDASQLPWTDGVPGTGEEGSYPPSAMCVETMDEIVNAITLAGLTPTSSDLFQLTRAIRGGQLDFDATDTGTADAIVCQIGLAHTAVVAGLPFSFIKGPNPNATTTPTLTITDPSGNNPISGTIVKSGGGALGKGDLLGGGLVTVRADAAGKFRLVSLLTLSDTTPPATPYTGQSLTNGGYYLVDVSQVTNFPLPNPATVPVGWKVRIKAINTPTGFQTSAVSALAGAAPTALMYRGTAHSPFYLIGNGEGFWFENTGTAYDVLTAGQPAQVSIFGSNPSGSTNLAGAGSNQYLPITSLSGSTAVFSTSSTVAAVNVPVSGDYQISASTRIYGSSATYGSGALTLTDSTAQTNIYDRTTAQANNAQSAYPKSVFRQYLRQGAGILALINNPGGMSTDTTADTFAITFANR